MPRSLGIPVLTSPKAKPMAKAMGILGYEINFPRNSEETRALSRREGEGEVMKSLDAGLAPLFAVQHCNISTEPLPLTRAPYMTEATAERIALRHVPMRG